MLRINRENRTPFYQQISNQIIEAIEEGVYPEGYRLPSIRKFAKDLDVSTNTVEYAYRLVSQTGYIQSHRNSGFTVSPLKRTAKPKAKKSADYEQDLQALVREAHATKPPQPIMYDFSYTNCDATLFPLSQWARLSREVLYGPDASNLYRYNDRQGLYSLRKQISCHLAQENGIEVVPEQIIIMPTTRILTASILELFDNKTDCVAMENPGFYEVRNEITYHGFNIVEIPVGCSSDTVLQQYEKHRPKLIYITPSNQYPTNRVMNLTQREQVLAWATQNDAYILEDDYCFEFRHGSNQLPTLQELDTQGHVISLGTFSKSFTPSVSIGFAVLPPKLMQRWLNPTNIDHSLVPWQTQAMLASFMEQGFWIKHLRTIQTAYRKKHDLLLKAIHDHLADKTSILDHETGIHILLKPNDSRSETTLIKQAAQKGVRVYPTSQCWANKPPKSWNYVLLGFSGIPIADIEPGIAALAQAWFE